MKYTPKHKIKSVEFTLDGEKYKVSGKDILNGIHELAKGGSLANYTYISKDNVLKFNTDSGSVKNNLNGVWVLTSTLSNPVVESAAEPVKRSFKPKANRSNKTDEIIKKASFGSTKKTASKSSKTDLDKFVDYINSFYGIKGIYPNELGKNITKKQVEKAIVSINSYYHENEKYHDWAYDSLDRELVRDELMRSGILTPKYNTPENDPKPKKASASKVKPTTKKVAPAKTEPLLSPSEKFKGLEDAPTEVFESAEKLVEMRKWADKKLIEHTIKGFENLLSDNQKDHPEAVAYTILWYQKNMPQYARVYDLTEAGSKVLMKKEILKTFTTMPFKSKAIKSIKTGNFLSNEAEQNLSGSFTGKDALRPAFMFTKIDDGYAVSTDTHLLLAINDKTLKGKDELVGYSKLSKGEQFKTPDWNRSHNYPKWRNVLPSTYTSYFTEEVRVDKLIDEISKALDYKILHPITHEVTLKFLDNQLVSFNGKLLLKSLIAMKQLSNYRDVYIHHQSASNKPVLLSFDKKFDLENGDSSFVLMMPIRVIDDEHTFIYDLNLSTLKYANGGFMDNVYKSGGRLKSAINRDRKYFNKSESWERAYSKGKNRKGYLAKGNYIKEYRDFITPSAVKKINELGYKVTDWSARDSYGQSSYITYEKNGSEYAILNVENANYLADHDLLTKSELAKISELSEDVFYAKGGKTDVIKKTKNPSDSKTKLKKITPFFVLVQEKRKEGESWKDAMKRVKEELNN